MGVVNKTIQYLGVELDIEFYFSPAEAEVRYYTDGSGHPGCGEEIEIYSIGHRGEDIMELLDDHLTDIEEKLIEEMYNN